MLYNNSRAVKAGAEHVDRFRQHLDFILNDGKPPTEIFLFLQLIVPVIIEGKEVSPSYMECAHYIVPVIGRFADIYTIGIDSFRFIVVALNGVLSISRRRVFDAFRTFPALEGARRLLHKETMKKIQASPITFLDVVGPGMMDDKELWEKHLKERGLGAI